MYSAIYIYIILLMSLGTWGSLVNYLWSNILEFSATGTCAWLRFYDAEGNLVLLEKELAEQERQRAERLSQLLRESGIDPDIV